jgi:hypothetical protein
VVLVGIAVKYRGPTWGEAMKIISRFALAVVAAAAIVFATSGPAVADVTVTAHKHCLYIQSLDGYVLIAEGVSEKAPIDPALENFHGKVHTGEPGDHVEIRRIGMEVDCPAQIPDSVVSAD